MRPIVFPTGKGTVEYHTHVVNRGFIPAASRGRYRHQDGQAKYTGMHALRHFYASLCINSREDGGLGLLPEGRAGAHGALVNHDDV